ncbi:MAG: hypothetical protein HWQ35_00320 [Nostoc sp. NMS1]|uniref:hypothetical protein n=1 Tax=Nostoc sp. NMS1 TaxID=2815388 RepID=UPI0025F38741|nr:hypothetical protein [Nostoc sp. NMS1]MBN3905069.1 hypothetical protein [Nostoc sp. NMS1]MBN3993991.1 hypothetical protein [Nostoc sp. NMS2]
MNLEKETFVQINQHSLAELLTFIDFADTQLTIVFILLMNLDGNLDKRIRIYAERSQQFG